LTRDPGPHPKSKEEKKKNEGNKRAPEDAFKT